MGEHRTAVEPDYDTDFFAWTQHQAKLLRALNGRRSDLPETLDIDHVAEEIEDLGKAEVNAAKNLIRQILLHLIKAASDPESPALSHWRAEATNFNVALPDRYAPSMRQLIEMQKLWQGARKAAAASLRGHGARLAADLPEECPFSLDEIISQDFDFDDSLRRLLGTGAN